MKNHTKTYMTALEHVHEAYMDEYYDFLKANRLASTEETAMLFLNYQERKIEESECCSRT